MFDWNVKKNQRMNDQQIKKNKKNNNNDNNNKNVVIKVDETKMMFSIA